MWNKLFGLSNNGEAKVDERKMNNLRFTDDIALITETKRIPGTTKKLFKQIPNELERNPEGVRKEKNLSDADSVIQLRNF